jgi:hypothetical protein
MSVHKDSSEIGAKSEQEGLGFLHQARKVRDLDAVRVERIARRLRRPAARPRRALLLPALLALALVMVAGATLATAQGGLSALPIVGSLFAPKPAPPPAPPHAGHARALPRKSGWDPRSDISTPAPAATAPLPEQVPPAALPEPAPIAQPAHAAAPALAHREASDKVVFQDARPHLGDDGHTVARPAEAPARNAGTEDAIVTESRAFAGVIESWRRQRDAGTALILLETYERRYPAGHMQLEARVLRAEIYLAQDRNDAALAVLDAVSLPGLPRARELQTVRGELRVKAGRCREARADLGDVLGANLTDALAKRATQALAHCP